jgi:protein-tyrosine-phosphatase
MFVCVGNLNRSPYAECHLKAFMQREAEAADAAGYDYCPAWAPASAGIAAIPGTPATDGMVWASKLSISWPLLEKHAARRYTPVLAQDYDEIFPLDAGVAGTVREFDTGGVPVTFSKHQDLPDPMGKTEADFREAATLIEEFISRAMLMTGVDLPALAIAPTPGARGHRNNYEDLYRK